MKLRVLDEARRELRDAFDYYESQRPGLGSEFATDIGAAIRRVLAFPNAWPYLDQPARHCIAFRFPFAVVYEIIDEQIVVLAIMHLHREPGYWRDRH